MVAKPQFCKVRSLLRLACLQGSSTRVKPVANGKFLEFLLEAGHLDLHQLKLRLLHRLPESLEVLLRKLSRLLSIGRVVSRLEA